MADQACHVFGSTTQVGIDLGDGELTVSAPVKTPVAWFTEKICTSPTVKPVEYS